MVSNELEDHIRLALRAVYRGRLNAKVREEIVEAVTFHLLREPGVLMRTLARSGHQPEHFLKVLGDDTWVVQHSLVCRVSGRMYDRCEIHRALEQARESGESPKPGRYVVSLRDGRMKLSRS